MDSFLSDVRFGLRLLRRRPGFAAIAILTIALGIGGNIAVLTLVQSVLLNPLAVAEPERLVNLYTTDDSVNVPGFTLLPTSYRNFEDYRETNEVFEALAYSVPVNVVLGGREEPEAIAAHLVSANYFDALGVTPATGRSFHPEEDELGGGHAVTVLSHALFSRRFASDPSILGSTIRINNAPFTVIGVAPPGFRGTMSLAEADTLFVTTSVYDRVLTDIRGARFLDRRGLFINAFGRLAEGLTMAEAREHMQGLAEGLAEAYGENRNRSVELGSMADAAYGATAYRAADESASTRRGAAVLLAVSALVLLIACVNLANLLLARGAERENEMALRAELGAAPRRLAQQLLVESLVLASLGGIAGLGLAAWGRDLLWRLRPPELQNATFQLAFDANVLALGALITLVTGALFGLMPAVIVAGKKNLSRVLGRGGRGSVGIGAGQGVIRSAFVAAQMALAFAALATAGLFMRSLAEGRAVDPGFDAERLATLSFDLAAVGYGPERGLAFQDEVLRELRAVSGVSGAALSQNAPVAISPYRSVVLEGEVEDPTRFGVAVTTNVVSDGYFETLGIDLVTGRTINGTDTADTRPVAVVSQAMAELAFEAKGRNAVGTRFRFGATERFYEVVGVVADAVVRNVMDDPIPVVYLASRQSFTPSMVVNLRAADSVVSIVPAARRTLSELDPNLAITDERLVRDVLAEGLWAPRAGAILLSLFAGLALALSAVGVYGVLAQTIGQRTREVGIRLAFGAARRDIYQRLIARGMIPAILGLGLGVLASMAIASPAASLLYKVSPTDPATFVVSASMLLLVALVGCYLPIRRAVKADPLQTLRSE